MRLYAVLTVFAAMLLCAGQAQAFNPAVCEEAGYLAGFDERLAAQPCVLVETFEIRTGGATVPMNVIRLAADRSGDDSRWTPHVQNLANRVGPQMDAMGGLRIAETTVLLTSLVEPANAHAVTRSDMERECKVSFYKTGRAVSVDEFTFTYAHELFHCIQAKTWRMRDNFISAKWWVEGSAEYFAHLVQQGTSFSDGWYAQFDRKSMRDSLLDLEYENVVFFLWLGERGPSAVKSFIDRMPESEGRAAQLAALQGAVPMERWIEFAQDYVDGEIRQPGGRAVPRPAVAMERITVDGPVRVPLNGLQYALARRVMVFERDATYALTLEEVEHGLRLRMSENSGEWSDPPSRVRACDEARTYIVLALAVEGNGRGVLNVQAPEERSERACCLIGEWKPDEASMRETAMMQNRIGGQMASAHGVQSPQCSHGGGDWTLTFSPSGKGSIVWDGFSNSCKVTLPRGDMVTTGTWNGTLGFDWDVSGNHRASDGRRYTVSTAAYTENTVMHRVSVRFGPVATRNMRPTPLSAPSSNNFTFQCSDNRLVVYGLYGLHPGAVHVPADQR